MIQPCNLGWLMTTMMTQVLLSFIWFNMIQRCNFGKDWLIVGLSWLFMAYPIPEMLVTCGSNKWEPADDGWTSPLPSMAWDQSPPGSRPQSPGTPMGPIVIACHCYSHPLPPSSSAFQLNMFRRFSHLWDSKALHILKHLGKILPDEWSGAHLLRVALAGAEVASPKRLMAPWVVTSFNSDHFIISGWWLGHPSEKYESQLGWWHSQY